jgi:hypothetical protein
MRGVAGKGVTMRNRHVTALVLLCLSIAALGTACQRSGSQTSTTSGTEGTQSQSPVQVARVDLGRGVGADNRVTDPTDAFTPNETIYATVVTNGSAPSAEIKTRWTFQDGQVVDETTRTIAPNGEAATEFHVVKPDGFPTGKYRVEVFLNGTQAATKEFEVKRT